MSSQPIIIESIRGRAIETGIDMRVSSNARHRVSTAETLRYHYRNPRLRQWILEFLNWLRCQGSLLIRGLSRCDGVEEFVADGTAVPAGFLEERLVRGRAVLSRPTLDIKFIYDIGVDMFAFARATGSRDISDAMGVLPRGSILYADGEFFVRENCVETFRRGIDFQVRPSRVFSCRILRRAAEVFRPGGTAGGRTVSAGRRCSTVFGRYGTGILRVWPRLLFSGRRRTTLSGC